MYLYAMLFSRLAKYGNDRLLFLPESPSGRNIAFHESVLQMR